MAIDTTGVKLEDRPIAQVREAVIDQLIMNYSHSVISEQAFERRLDIATNSDDPKVLIEQVADLTLEPDAKYRAMWSQNFDATTAARGSAKAKVADELTDKDRLVSILSSDERSGPWRVPQHLTIINALSSVELDFSEAVFEHQHMILQLTNWLGSVSIQVPEHVAVISELNNIAASSDNSVGSGGPGSRKTHCIRIEGYSVLGSLDVSIKRSLKQRFTDFANSIRSALGLDKA
ncbi:LiaF-related protein [Alkalimonas sp. MEB108]|uniref:LiaF-related protein n=1 Tax=Alkalimonas cellulosilytica TaxID=3058395 RepID=A0ABU7J8C6_9GAMM|nr:LiaF domain-containing protein [Alkalimonas sp. MEB108]MEE2002801.1 LiaF-related protein [Alkalimonas sp. MEB108]